MIVGSHIGIPVRILLCFLFFVTTSSLKRDEVNQNITLNTQQTHIITLPSFADSVRLSRSGVVSLQRGRSKAELRVTGEKSGHVRVDVTLEDTSKRVFYIHVIDQQQQIAQLEILKGRLSDIRGVSLAVRNNQIVISGRVTNRQDQQRLQAATRQNPNSIVDLTEPDIPPTNTVVTTINRILQQNNITNIQAKAYGRIVVLHGTPRDESERDLAIQIARMIERGVEDRMSQDASAAPAIHIDVLFIEVQKRHNLNFGLNGHFSLDHDKDNSSAAIVRADLKGRAGSFGSLSWKVGSLSALLIMLQNTASSRVLSNPQLVARSGTRATFHSGGILNIETSQTTPAGRDSSLHQVNYGIQLDILPKIDHLGLIDASIEATASDLGAAHDGNVPSLVRSSVSTSVSIQDGQSIILSGLVSKRQRKAVARVPLLADIPLLGEIFKSRQLDSEDIELLVLVTMNRVSASDERNLQPLDLWNRAADDVSFSIFD